MYNECILYVFIIIIMFYIWDLFLYKLFVLLIWLLFFYYVICIIYNIVVGKVYDIRKGDCFKEIRKLYWNKFNINFNEIILIVIKFIFCNIYINI